jgi:phospholipid/cholesterol/gamma-HCH transport system substrate-binding protein
MFLERNQVIIGLIASAVLLAGTVFAIFATGGMFAPGTRVSAEFTDVAGLEPGAFVFVAGVKNGQVLGIEPLEDRVKVEFSIEADGIPADSGVSIILQNTLGKRAIKVEPGTSSTPFADGDVVPLNRTSTPIDLPELGDRSAELLGEVNVDALQELTTALADVTEGQKEEVADLLDGVQRVTRIISDKKLELGQVIDRTEVLVDAAATKDQEIVRIIDAFGSTLDTLAQRRNDVSRLLSETALATDISADLVESRRGQIDRILFELRDDLKIVDAHQVDLAHTMAYLGVGIEGFASIGYGNGPARTDNPDWGNVFVTGLGGAGADVLLGCGGTFDAIFTELIGPDPNCTEDRPGNPTLNRGEGDQDAGGNRSGGGSNEDTDGAVDTEASTDTSSTDRAPYGRLGDFFDLGGER